MNDTLDAGNVTVSIRLTTTSERYGRTNTHSNYKLTNAHVTHRGCSSGVERSLRMRDVLGSIPSISTLFLSVCLYYRKGQTVDRVSNDCLSAVNISSHELVYVQIGLN